MRGIIEDPKKLNIEDILHDKEYGGIESFSLSDEEGNKLRFKFDKSREEFLTDDPIPVQVIPPYSKLLEGNLEDGYYIWYINGLHCERIDISVPKSIVKEIVEYYKEHPEELE